MTLNNFALTGIVLCLVLIATCLMFWIQTPWAAKTKLIILKAWLPIAATVVLAAYPKVFPDYWPLTSLAVFSLLTLIVSQHSGSISCRLYALIFGVSYTPVPFFSLSVLSPAVLQPFIGINDWLLRVDGRNMFERMVVAVTMFFLVLIVAKLSFVYCKKVSEVK